MHLVGILFPHMMNIKLFWLEILLITSTGYCITVCCIEEEWGWWTRETVFSLQVSQEWFVVKEHNAMVVIC